MVRSSWGAATAATAPVAAATTATAAAAVAAAAAPAARGGSGDGGGGDVEEEEEEDEVEDGGGREAAGDGKGDESEGEGGAGGAAAAGGGGAGGKGSDRRAFRLGEGFAPIEGVGAALSEDEFEQHAKETIQEAVLSGDVNTFLRIAEETNADQGPRARARYVTVALELVVLEQWEERETATAGKVVLELMRARLLTRADLADELADFIDDDGASTYNDLKEDMPRAHEVLADVLLAAWLEGGVDEAALPAEVLAALRDAAQRMREEQRAAEEAERKEKEKKEKEANKKPTWKDNLAARRANAY